MIFFFFFYQTQVVFIPEKYVEKTDLFTVMLKMFGKTVLGLVIFEGFTLVLS